MIFCYTYRSVPSLVIFRKCYICSRRQQTYPETDTMQMYPSNTSLQGSENLLKIDWFSIFIFSLFLPYRFFVYILCLLVLILWDSWRCKIMFLCVLYVSYVFFLGSLPSVLPDSNFFFVLSCFISHHFIILS